MNSLSWGQYDLFIGMTLIYLTVEKSIHKLNSFAQKMQCFTKYNYFTKSREAISLLIIETGCQSETMYHASTLKLSSVKFQIKHHFSLSVRSMNLHIVQMRLARHLIAV